MSYIRLVIVVCCLRAALLASGCKITEPDFLKALDPDFDDKKWLWGLQHLLNDYEGEYTRAIADINTAWKTEPWSVVNEHPEVLMEKVSAGLIKCNVYAWQLQCSSAVWAKRSADFMHSVMVSLSDRNANPEENEYPNRLFKLFLDTLTSYFTILSSILFKLGYAPPKWLPAILILIDDLVEKIDIFTLEKEADAYLIEATEVIIKLVIGFLNTCQTEKITQGITSNIIEGIIVTQISELNQKHTFLVDSLNEKMKFYMGREKNTILGFNEELKTPHLVQNWFKLPPDSVSYTGKVRNSVSLQTLVMGKKWAYLGIDWMTDTNKSNKNKTTLNGLKVNEKNWKIITFLESYATIFGSLNHIKNNYRLVVVRFVLINVSDCDYLRYQILRITNYRQEGEQGDQGGQGGQGDQGEQDLEKFHTKFSQYCSKIISNVQSAIDYLAGDAFLEALLPELVKFNQGMGENASNILMGVMAELNRISEMLRVSGSLYYRKPRLPILSYEEIDQKFRDDAQRIQDADNYTSDLKKYFPTLNFEVVKFMSEGANNPWIAVVFN